MKSFDFTIRLIAPVYRTRLTAAVNPVPHNNEVFATKVLKTTVRIIENSVTSLRCSLSTP